MVASMSSADERAGLPLVSPRDCAGRRDRGIEREQRRVDDLGVAIGLRAVGHRPQDVLGIVAD